MKCNHALRRLSVALLLAASAGAAPAYAQISVNISLAPPAPQHEIVPVMPSGYVWAPGYWGWNGERHVWIRGRSIVQREGHRWEPDRWEQRSQGYYRTAGHWERVKVKKEKKHKDRHDDDRGHRGRGHGDDGSRGERS